MNLGLQNEQDIINILDDTYVKDLPSFWKKFVCSLFPTALDDDLVHCYKEPPEKKQDICIMACGTRRNVSIKSGNGISVHEETINRFCGFLRWCGITEQSITFLKIYQYGDGTIDGTGEYRMSTKELIEKYPKEIKSFNEEVNNSSSLIMIIRRFLSIGTPNNPSVVNCLYYGTKDGGIYCNMKMLCEYLAKKKYDNIKGIHFGPFTFYARYRGLNKPKPVEVDSLDELIFKRSRYYISVKWPSIEKDMNDFIADTRKEIKERNKKYY